MTRLSIIVATLGRPTLARTLRSIAAQARFGDEIIVVAAKGTDTAAIEAMAPPTDATFLFLSCGDQSNHGDAEKNLGIAWAAGTHLAFMDDDDVYTPGALDLMREAACDRVVMFRMDATSLGLGVLWRDPVLRYTNVSTQMFVVPNDPGRLGVWAPHERTEGTDFTFIAGCCERMGDPVWREEIIAVLRPQPSIAVVTPWLDHPELLPDYAQAVFELRETDQLIVVDNGSSPPLDLPGIRLEENVGFSAACNLGLRAATTDAVLFLNNDVAATAHGWLDVLRTRLAPGVLAGARIRYDRHGDVDGHKLPYLDGWCLSGMRSDLLDLGGFDEGYEEPSYYGDNDLSLRARSAGMTLREVGLGLLHKESMTARDDQALVDRASRANRERFASRSRELLGDRTTA